MVRRREGAVNFREAWNPRPLVHYTAVRHPKIYGWWARCGPFFYGLTHESTDEADLTNDPATCLWCIAQETVWACAK